MTACPYCKDEAIGPEVIYCPACDVAHHIDCWEANGETCSVFGCQFRKQEDLVGCPWCEEVYQGERRFCMTCNSPLMTPRQCAEFVARYDWVPLRLPEDANLLLTAGYLRNYGITARISRRAPISMFGIGPRITLLVDAQQEGSALELLRELSERFTYCDQCGHVLLVDELECSYCAEGFGAG